MELALGQFVTLPLGPDLPPIQVGIIPRDKLLFRRPNYRKMNKLQWATLQAGIAKLGFQSLLVVVKVMLEDGTWGGDYGLVDGHHRLEELDKMGVTTIPVLLLPDDTTAEDADLGMLSMNVSAELDDRGFGAFIQDMMSKPDRYSLEDIALHGTLSMDYLESLKRALQPLEPLPGGEAELPSSGSGAKGPKARKVPKVKLVVLLTFVPVEPEKEDSEFVPIPWRYVLCPDTMIVSAEVRDGLDGLELGLDEIELPYVESDTELIEMTGQMLADEEAAADQEEEETPG